MVNTYLIYFKTPEKLRKVNIFKYIPRLKVKNRILASGLEKSQKIRLVTTSSTLNRSVLALL
jgi:hypothetical protein